MNNNGRYDFEKELTWHDSFVYSVATGPDGFFSCGKDRKIFQMDADGNPVGEFEGHENTVNCVKVLDANHIITGSWDGTAKIWDLETK
jgi:WD40 repeat protein